MKLSYLSLNGAVLIALLLLSCPAASNGQVYRWIDKDGAVHFTDNPQNIPNEYKPRVEEFTPPPITTYEDQSGSRPGISSRMEQAGATTGMKGAEDPVRELQESIEALQSQIKAKRELIQYVEDRQNLAINPYRNRIITEKELELYDRYIQELPGDERELERLEADLKSIQTR